MLQPHRAPAGGPVSCSNVLGERCSLRRLAVYCAVRVECLLWQPHRVLVGGWVSIVHHTVPAYRGLYHTLYGAWVSAAGQTSAALAEPGAGKLRRRAPSSRHPLPDLAGGSTPSAHCPSAAAGTTSRPSATALSTRSWVSWVAANVGQAPLMHCWSARRGAILVHCTCSDWHNGNAEVVCASASVEFRVLITH